jgi:hypothetical protein
VRETTSWAERDRVGLTDRASGDRGVLSRQRPAPPQFRGVAKEMTSGARLAAAARSMI